MSLSCKLVRVQYREDGYKISLFAIFWGLEPGSLRSGDETANYEASAPSTITNFIYFFRLVLNVFC